MEQLEFLSEEFKRVITHHTVNDIEFCLCNIDNNLKIVINMISKIPYIQTSTQCMSYISFADATDNNINKIISLLSECVSNRIMSREPYGAAIQIIPKINNVRNQLETIRKSLHELNKNECKENNDCISSNNKQPYIIYNDPEFTQYIESICKVSDVFDKFRGKIRGYEAKERHYLWILAIKCCLLSDEDIEHLYQCVPTHRITRCDQFKSLVGLDIYKSLNEKLYRIFSIGCSLDYKKLIGVNYTLETINECGRAGILHLALTLIKTFILPFGEFGDLDVTLPSENIFSKIEHPELILPMITTNDKFHKVTNEIEYESYKIISELTNKIKNAKDMNSAMMVVRGLESIVNEATM